MADEKRPSGPPGGKRRRPPATIDLKATEVASEPVTPTERTDFSEETPRAEAAGAAAEPKPQATLEPPQAPPSRAGSWRREWVDVAALNDRIAALRAQLSEQMSWRLIAAGVAGAGAVLIALIALWMFGATGSRDDLAAPLAARVATLETQVRDLAAKPAPARVDQRALADLDARVAKAEQTVAAPRPAQTDQALTDRVAVLEASVRPLSELGQKIDVANAAARDAKGRADAAFEAAQKSAPAVAADHKEIEALAQRIAALEQAAKSAEEKIARAATSAGADRAGRLAFVAVALRSAVERGEPFTQALAAAKPLVPDAAALASLEPFATSGVPRAAALARELSQRSNAMLSAAGNVPREGGILDRLQQNAERLVRIRPINEAPGDDPATIVARAEAKATQGDISGALKELSQLPDPVRAPAQAWIKKAEAQVAALAAVRVLAENAVGALGKP